MIRIKLLGELADRFISEFEAEVSTVAEAIACLRANFPQFSGYLFEANQRGIAYKISVGWQDIEEKELVCPFSKKVRSITISPIPMGAGGNLGKIVLGAALLGLGLAGVGFLGLSAQTLAITGGALLLGGVSALFGRTKSPEDDEREGKKSLVFGSPTQTVREGGRVPILYGVHLTGWYIISARIRSYLSVA